MKITTIEKKTGGPKQQILLIQNGSGQAIQGKNQQKPGKARKQYKIKELKKNGKTQAKP